VILTARHGGVIMNDALVWTPAAVNNVFSPSGVLTITETTPGTGTPDLSAALASLGDDPADFTVSPWTDASNLTAAIACFNDVSGRWAWYRQIYGHYYGAYTGSFSATVTFGLTLNDRHQTILRRWASSLSPSWEWAAGMVARVAPWLSDTTLGNVSRNQTGLRVEGVYGPVSRAALDNYSARNTLNNSGISTARMDFDGTVMVDKIITTSRFGTSGQPDTVFRDIQRIYQVAGGISYMRAVLAQEHGQKALANENPGNLAAISTPADVKGTAIHAHDDLCFRGVFQDNSTFARLIQAKINEQNPDRLDMYMPIETVNPLDILAANATFYQAYPRALLGGAQQ
jgi:phage tail sheath gpL-like